MGLKGELNTTGCVKLMGAVVTHALTNDQFKERTPAVLRRRAKSLEDFSKTTFLDYFADAYAIHPSRVRKALMRRAGELEEEATFLSKLNKTYGGKAKPKNDEVARPLDRKAELEGRHDRSGV